MVLNTDMTEPAFSFCKPTGFNPMPLDSRTSPYQDSISRVLAYSGI